MAKIDILNSLQTSIKERMDRITDLEERISSAQEMARRMVKAAQELVEEAKILKSQLKNERIIQAESATTLSTLLVGEPETRVTAAADTLAQSLLADIEETLRGGK